MRILCCFLEQNKMSIAFNLSSFYLNKSRILLVLNYEAWAVFSS